jgi:hypothetical protein
MTKKAIAEAVVHAVEDTGGLMGLFDDTPTAKEEKKPETSATFTGEQDKTLMEMKDSNKTWAEIATKLDKDADECKARFKLIKPADWKPTEKGGNQKKEQNKKGDKGKDQGKKSQKESEKKEESTNTKGNDNRGILLTFPVSNNLAGNGNNESTDNNGTTGNGGSNNMGGHNMWGSWETAPENAGENADTGKGEESWGKDQWGDADGGEQTWKGDGGGDDAWATVDGAADSGNTGSGAKEGANAWDTTETWGQTPTGGDSSSKPGSKAPSKSGSKAPSKKSTTKPQPAVASTPTPTTEPLMYEITPDDTFSADDLRAIARILQQDAKMVWNRVSWRFRDKTGRNVDPDVFEEKITGRIEGKGREERSQSGG